MTAVKKVYKSRMEAKQSESIPSIVGEILDRSESKLKFYIEQANIFIDDFGQLSLTRQDIAGLATRYDVLNVLANEDAIPEDLSKRARRLQRDYGKLIESLESGHYMNAIQSRGIQVVE